MNSKVLVVGFACLSAMAMAQSSAKSSAPSTDSQQQQVSAPRDSATGQASGKRMHKPFKVTAEVGAQDQSATTQPSKKSAADDWSSPIAKVGGSKTSNESPTLTPVKSSTTAAPKSAVLSTSGGGDVKSPRDLATGQASGK